MLGNGNGNKIENENGSGSGNENANANGNENGIDMRCFIEHHNTQYASVDTLN